MLLPVAVAVLAVAVAAPAARAQDVRPLRGVVFDSLRQAPLAEAVVRVRGSTGLATTDARGRFRFDSVAAGAVVLEVEHALLDSIGLFTLAARVQHDGRTEHRLGVPSFATIARPVCGRAVGADSALLYGAVLDANGGPAGGAAVAVSWLAVQRTTDGKLGQQRLTYTTTADSLGRFAACGLPADEPYTLDVRAAGADSGRRVVLTLPAQAARVLRHEVMLPASAVDATDSVVTVTGVVRGTVRGLQGEAIVGARVSGDEVPEVLTDSAGRFFLPRVPTGSRQLEVIALGRTPQSRLVQVRARDTLEVAFTLERVTTLAGVRTEATVVGELVRGYEERLRTGLGRFRDSVELARMPSMASAFDGLPNLIVRRGAGGFGLQLRTTPSIATGVTTCAPRVFIDGRPDDMQQLNLLQPRDIAWVEVYTRPGLIPIEFMEGIQNRACGVVVVMTKRKLGR